MVFTAIERKKRGGTLFSWVKNILCQSSHKSNYQATREVSKLQLQGTNLTLIGSNAKQRFIQGKILKEEEFRHLKIV